MKCIGEINLVFIGSRKPSNISDLLACFREPVSSGAYRTIFRLAPVSAGN